MNNAPGQLGLIRDQVRDYLLVTPPFQTLGESLISRKRGVIAEKIKQALAKLGAYVFVHTPLPTKTNINLPGLYCEELTLQIEIGERGDLNKSGYEALYFAERAAAVLNGWTSQHEGMTGPWEPSNHWLVEAPSGTSAFFCSLLLSCNHHANVGYLIPAHSAKLAALIPPRSYSVSNSSRLCRDTRTLPRVSTFGNSIDFSSIGSIPLWYDFYGQSRYWCSTVRLRSSSRDSFAGAAGAGGWLGHVGTLRYLRLPCSK